VLLPGISRKRPLDSEGCRSISYDQHSDGYFEHLSSGDRIISKRMCPFISLDLISHYLFVGIPEKTYVPKLPISKELTYN
jgi:hypothetical protein